MGQPHGMPELTLDEELFLLTRDEDSGKDQTSWGVDGPLAKEHRKGAQRRAKSFLREGPVGGAVGDAVDDVN